MNADPKILVIGAGAIGGVTAGFLKKAGFQVQLVTKYIEVARQVSTTGLFVQGIRGKFQIPMEAVASVSELKEKKDLVFHATKTTDMLGIAQELLPFLHENSLVVSLQNGVSEPALMEVLGKERVIGCVVGWGATLLKPGEVEMTSEGEFVIGSFENPNDPRLQLIQSILSHVLPVEISKNILGSLYSKLIINSCITSLGALSGLYLGEQLRQYKIRKIFLEIMREGINVSNAMGLKVEPYGEKKLDYYKLLKGNSFLKNLSRHLLILFIGIKFRKLKSSSLQSLERGKPTEIDWLNGFIVEQGKIHKIPTPTNSKIVDMIHQIERGERQISPLNLNELVGF